LAEKELDIADAIITNPNCFGEATGQIELTATNGIAPFQFNLNGAGLEDAASLLNLTAGSYNIQVVDAEQCTGSTDVIITDPDAISVTLEGNTISCFGHCGKFTTRKLFSDPYRWTRL